jgi:hypothetical protein
MAQTAIDEKIKLHAEFGRSDAIGPMTNLVGKRDFMEEWIAPQSFSSPKVKPVGISCLPPQVDWQKRWHLAAAESSMDAYISIRFGDLWQKAHEGELSRWMNKPHSAIALILMLDTFTKNIAREKTREASMRIPAMRKQVESFKQRERTALLEAFARADKIGLIGLEKLNETGPWALQAKRRAKNSFITKWYFKWFRKVIQSRYLRAIQEELIKKSEAEALYDATRPSNNNMWKPDESVAVRLCKQAMEAYAYPYRDEKLGLADPWEMRPIERAAMALPLLHTMNVYDLEACSAYYHRLHFHVVGEGGASKHPHAEMLGKLGGLATANLVALRNHGSFFMKTMAMYNTSSAFLMNNKIFVEPKEEKEEKEENQPAPPISWWNVKAQVDEHEMQRERRKYKMGCPNGEYSKQDRAALKICIGDDLSFKDSTAGKRLYGGVGAKK